jgi:hypothetical protein
MVSGVPGILFSTPDTPFSDTFHKEADGRRNKTPATGKIKFKMAD